nr:beta-glucosidase 44-like [Ipomoea batatas]
MLLLYLTEPLSYALEFNLVCREDFADYAEFYLLQNIWRSSEELGGALIALRGTLQLMSLSLHRCSQSHSVLCHAAAAQRYHTKYQANSDWLYMVPWGLYKTVTYVKEQYGNPRMFLSENGMDYDGKLTLAESFNNTKRISYYKSYLGEVKRAVDHGANLFGYFAWSSLVDNFEWRLG